MVAKEKEQAKPRNEWVYQSKDADGRVVTIDVEKLLRFVDEKFNLGFVRESIEE